MATCRSKNCPAQKTYAVHETTVYISSTSTLVHQQKAKVPMNKMERKLYTPGNSPKSTRMLHSTRTDHTREPNSKHYSRNNNAKRRVQDWCISKSNLVPLDVLASTAYFQVLVSQKLKMLYLASQENFITRQTLAKVFSQPLIGILTHMRANAPAQV